MGAGEGLGLAAVKFLAAREQHVIALAHDRAHYRKLLEEETAFLHILNTHRLTTEEIQKMLRKSFAELGPLHHIINNANYNLFHDPPSSPGGLQHKMDQSIANTMALINALLPYLKRSPESTIINLPPQFCLAMIDDKAAADLLSSSLNLFLHRLRRELEALGRTVSFLLPGEQALSFDI